MSHRANQHGDRAPAVITSIPRPSQMAGHLDFLTQELEASAYPALDALAKKVRQRTRGRGRGVGAGKGAATGQEGTELSCGARSADPSVRLSHFCPRPIWSACGVTAAC